jgi:hypothetical protein
VGVGLVGAERQADMRDETNVLFSRFFRNASKNSSKLKLVAFGSR